METFSGGGALQATITPSSAKAAKRQSMCPHLLSVPQIIRRSAPPVQIAKYANIVGMLPTAQLGCILPPRVGDAIHYQFYLTCPPDLMLVVYPLNLRSFTEAGIEEALGSFWPAFDFLVSRKVDRIVQVQRCRPPA